MRLDKYLNDVLKIGRKDVQRIIRSGRITVNGFAQTVPEFKINECDDRIFMDGKELAYRSFVYYMMNKPDGVVTAMEDHHQTSIANILSEDILKQNIFPVGRLDKDTTGLLLLTNDGQFAHKMISPKYNVEKVYHVKYMGTLDHHAEELFANGIVLSDGTKCLPAKLELMDTQECIVTITEGKYHQIKRMIATVGGRVEELHRERIGGISLDPTLAKGEYRQLSDNELCILMTLF